MVLFLTTLVNSLDQDQARQAVGPDQDPNYLTLVVLKGFLKVIIGRQKQACKELIFVIKKRRILQQRRLESNSVYMYFVLNNYEYNVTAPYLKINPRLY